MGICGGMRIATASVRTGFAMTPLTRSAGERRDTWGPPYSHTFCRAGPACPAGSAKKTRSGRCRHRPIRKRNKRCNGRATARVAPTKALQGVRSLSGGGGREPRPTLYYVPCGAWGRGCKRPFARQQGGGAPRPVGGIFASYLFRSSKFSAVTMDWTLVHRGAKVLARSS